MKTHTYYYSRSYMNAFERLYIKFHTPINGTDGFDITFYGGVDLIMYYHAEPVHSTRIDLMEATEITRGEAMVKLCNMLLTAQEVK